MQFFLMRIEGADATAGIGWNMNYPFNTGDLLCCGQCAANYLDANTKIPWEDLRLVIHKTHEINHKSSLHLFGLRCSLPKGILQLVCMPTDKDQCNICLRRRGQRTAASLIIILLSSR